MARLEIRRRADVPPGMNAWGSGYQFLVDGREIEHLTEVSLKWAQGDIATACLRFFVTDLDIDADALVALHAMAAEKGVTLPPAALEQIVGEVLARVRRAEG